MVSIPLLFCWRLILACLPGNFGRVERWQLTGFHQILKELGFSHEQLRLQLASLERHAMQQG
jgi:hypothetical protein